jgi:hypothetical protein
MGAHFSGLSLKKWSPSRAALGGFWGCPKSLVLRGWSAGKGIAAVFMIHKFKILPFSCITSRVTPEPNNWNLTPIIRDSRTKQLESDPNYPN